MEAAEVEPYYIPSFQGAHMAVSFQLFLAFYILSSDILYTCLVDIKNQGRPCLHAAS